MTFPWLVGKLLRKQMIQLTQKSFWASSFALLIQTEITIKNNKVTLFSAARETPAEYHIKQISRKLKMTSLLTNYLLCQIQTIILWAIRSTSIRTRDLSHWEDPISWYFYLIPTDLICFNILYGGEHVHKKRRKSFSCSIQIIGCKIHKHNLFIHAWASWQANRLKHKQNTYKSHRVIHLESPRDRHQK